LGAPAGTEGAAGSSGPLGRIRGRGGTGGAIVKGVGKIKLERGELVGVPIGELGCINRAPEGVIFIFLAVAITGRVG